MRKHFGIVLVLLLVLFLLSGCVLNEFFAVTPKPGETPEQHKARQDAAAAKVGTGMNTLLGVLGMVWPPSLAFVGGFAVAFKKYKHIHAMLVAVIKAIDNAAPKKTDDEPVKSAVRALDNAPLNKIVYDTTH